MVFFSRSAAQSSCFCLHSPAGASWKDSVFTRFQASFIRSICSLILSFCCLSFAVSVSFLTNSRSHFCGQSVVYFKCLLQSSASSLGLVKQVNWMKELYTCYIQLWCPDPKYYPLKKKNLKKPSNFLSPPLNSDIFHIPHTSVWMSERTFWRPRGQRKSHIFYSFEETTLYFAVALNCDWTWVLPQRLKINLQWKYKERNVTAMLSW